jgi:hypothetical protein
MGDGHHRQIAVYATQNGDPCKLYFFQKAYNPPGSQLIRQRHAICPHSVFSCEIKQVSNGLWSLRSSATFFRRETTPRRTFDLSNELAVPTRATGHGSVADEGLEGFIIITIQPIRPIRNCIGRVPQRVKQGIHKPVAAGAGAGPTVVRGLPCQMRSDGIPLNVAYGIPEMAAFEDAREWTFLPKMSDESVFRIESPGVLAVRPMKCAPDGIRAFRHCNQVNMIRHQAISPHSQKELPAAFPQ